MAEEEDQHAPRRKKPMNSGMDRTGATTEVNRVTWPHKVVYSLVVKPDCYQDMSIPQFVLGYMILMEGEEVAIILERGWHHIVRS